MRSLELSFDGNELVSTLFQHTLLGNPLVSVRGKTGGAFGRTAGSFQWTTGVQAIALLFVGTKLASYNKSSESKEFLLSGRAGSFAVSLDNAIAKDVNWLQDMFGTDPSGRSLVRRLLLRSNSGMKRNGPVAISINLKFLPITEVKICDAQKHELPEAELRRLLSLLDPQGQQGSCAPHSLDQSTLKDESSVIGLQLNRYEFEDMSSSLLYAGRFG